MVARLSPVQFADLIGTSKPRSMRAAMVRQSALSALVPDRPAPLFDTYVDPSGKDHA